MMLCDETALAIQQPELGAAAQLSHHRAGRMRHVGVERRAEERQPAGHRRLHVGAKAQRPPRHFRHAGKAAVELDGVELPAVAADEVHHRLEHGVLRVAFEELVAAQIVARLLRRRTAPDVNETILRYPRSLRLREAGQEHRAAHVDGRIGHHQLVVGPGDQPVVRRRRRDLVRRKTSLQPGIGILRGDAGIGRPQRARFRHRLARGLAPMRRRSCFVERIDRDRLEHAELYRHRLLERGAALRLFDVLRERRPRQIDFGAFGLGGGRSGLRRRRPPPRCIRRARSAARLRADSGSGSRRRPDRNRRAWV